MLQLEPIVVGDESRAYQCTCTRPASRARREHLFILNTFTINQFFYKHWKIKWKKSSKPLFQLSPLNSSVNSVSAVFIFVSFSISLPLISSVSTQFNLVLTFLHLFALLFSVFLHFRSFSSFSLIFWLFTFIYISFCPPFFRSFFYIEGLLCASASTATISKCATELQAIFHIMAWPWQHERASR